MGLFNFGNKKQDKKVAVNIKESDTIIVSDEVRALLDEQDVNIELFNKAMKLRRTDENREKLVDILVYIATLNDEIFSKDTPTELRTTLTNLEKLLGSELDSYYE